MKGVRVRNLYLGLALLFVGVLNLGIANVAASRLNLVSVGLIDLDPANYSDSLDFKSMYPVVTANKLVFLIVNEKQGREKDIIYSVSLDEIFKKKSHVPNARWLRINKEEGIFNSHNHSLFYSIFGDGTGLKQEGSRDTLEDTVGMLGSKILPKGGESPRDLKRGDQGFFTGFWLGEKGLKQKKETIFSCGNTISFSARLSPRASPDIVVNYFDQQNVPRISKVTSLSTGMKCDSSTLTGFEPHISPSGKYLGFLRINKANRDQSDLLIHDYHKLEKVFLKRNVKLYDIKVHDFKYKKSISWLRIKNREFLYFIPNKRQNRDIGRVECNNGCSLPERLQIPKCFNLSPAQIYEPFGSEGTAEVVRSPAQPVLGWMQGNSKRCVNPKAFGHPMLLVSEVMWAVPFKYEGRSYIAVQAVVSGKYRERKDRGDLHLMQNWAPRILILRSRT